MAWVRIDDQAPRHRKLLRAGPAACWLWVCALAHAQSQLSNGFIPDEALPMIGVKGETRCVKLADVLVSVGLFERSEGGYQIHDYLAYNATADEARERQQQIHDGRSKAGRVGGMRSGEARRLKREANEANAKQTTEANRSPIPSHPIQVREKDACAPFSAPARGGVLAGTLPRDHCSHAACDDTFSRCVPQQVHDKLANLLAPKHAGDRQAAKAALQAWYPGVWASLPADFVMGDAFRFWQGRFDAAFSSTDAVSARSFGKPEPQNTTPGVDETRALLRALKGGA